MFLKQMYAYRSKYKPRAGITVDINHNSNDGTMPFLPLLDKCSEDSGNKLALSVEVCYASKFFSFKVDRLAL